MMHTVCISSYSHLSYFAVSLSRVIFHMILVFLLNFIIVYKLDTTQDFIKCDVHATKQPVTPDDYDMAHE